MLLSMFLAEDQLQNVVVYPLLTEEGLCRSGRSLVLVTSELLSFVHSLKVIQAMLKGY